MNDRDRTRYKVESVRRKKARIAKQRRRRKIRFAIHIGLFVCMVSFVVGGVITGKVIMENNNAKKVYDGLRSQLQKITYNSSISVEALSVQDETLATSESQPSVRTSAIDFAPLKALNNEIVAWLSGDGTVIDYPILRADNNDYYLDHLYTKESNRMGSLFVDYRNTGLFTDLNTVIYGHNMKSGAMFNSLSEYKAQDFYDAFPNMSLYTPNGDYTIALLSGTIEDDNYEFVQFEFDDSTEFMSYFDSAAG